MQVNYKNIVYVVGNNRGCFAYYENNQIAEIEDSLHCLLQKLKEQGFLKINDFTIFNTKYFIGKKPKRQINLKGGSIHKVSRNMWKHFKDLPT